MKAFKSMLITISLLLFAWVPGQVYGQGHGYDHSYVAPALNAAKSWLALLDEGRYEESWDEASTYFQNSVPKEKWLQMANAVRPPLGAVVKRKSKTMQKTETLPGAPDGLYVVIKYSSSFEHKAQAIETIIPVQEADGSWKIASYYIR